MAHAARLDQLVGQLITSITGPHEGNREARQLHDRTLRGLKNTTHARTNQFDVKSRLDGLVEKFAVLNRDDLSEGLQGRLDELLPTESKWLPEILSLLLVLSDRPVDKTTFADVEDATRIEDQHAALTWAEIVADDPLDEAGIWDDVERGYHSSDDDFTADENASGDETQATSIAEDDPVALAQLHVLQVDDTALNDVKVAREKLDAPTSGGAVSELTLIRESLYTLHGLPSSLYGLDASDGSVRLQEPLKVATASRGVLDYALQEVASLATTLTALRLWARSVSRTQTIRACKAKVATELTTIAAQLASIEQCYVKPQTGSVASLLEMKTDVDHLARPFTTLMNAVKAQGTDRSDDGVALLDRLYDETCIAHLAGDDATFEILQMVLGAGLKPYLRPVTRWIAAGECAGHDDFFVFEADAGCELGRFWRDRYALRRDGFGHTVAPAFMQPFVARIFALGKGRAFMRALSDDAQEADEHHVPPTLRLHAESGGLVPFSQNLADAFETWIAEQSKDHTPLLRKSILHGSGLLSTVDALQEVFCSRNGRRLQTFTDTLFWRLDSGVRWDDEFLLTELAQATLGNADDVVAESIAVQVAPVQKTKDGQPAVKAESSIRSLQNVHLRYNLPWPLQNVTGSASSETYAKASALLLLIYRAKCLVRQHVFDNRRTALQHCSSAALFNALRLHQRLTIVVDILHAHVTTTSSVLSSALKQDMAAAEDIDAMAAVWQKHEQLLGTSLLVTDKLGPVREAVTGILEMCERLVRIHDGPSVDDGDSDGQAKSDGAALQTMHKELDSTLFFMLAGLRGVARAGGNTALERLAERVEWIMQFQSASQATE